MIENHVTANLFMVLIIVVGLLSVFSLKQEIFPDTPLDTISIEIVYKGALPDEIERTIVRKTEDAIIGINGIRQVRSIAAEGIGIVTAEIGSNQDLTHIKEKITNAVERLTDLPKNSRKPIIKENIKNLPVIEIGIFGSVDEITLRNSSKRVEQDLLQFPQISHIEVSGVRDFEIAIEVSEQSLQENNLTFDYITEAVRKGSINLPGGKIKNERGEILIRTDGLGMTKEHYENIVVKTDAAGKIIRIGDIADVIEGFEDTNLFTSFDGKPAALITVYRTGNYGAPEVAEVVKKYVEELETTAPKTLSYVVWQDRSVLLQQRLRLLLKNTAIGFVLVAVTLTLFLEIRLAFWVALGIVLSFLGAFVVMALCDVTINMISLFAFIIVLGIVVDDAIVIGESIYSKRDEGLLPIDASKQGTSQIMVPVIFGVFTTIAAFIPLFFIDGIMGKIAEVVAVVVISVLFISLFEALFILPAHIALVKRNPTNGLIILCNKLSLRVNAMLQLFIEKVFNPILKICLLNRFTVCALCIAALLMCFGLLYSGIIKFTFLPVVEGDTVCAQLTMSSGSSFEETKRVVESIEHAAALVQKEFRDKYPHLRESLFLHNYAIIGEHPSNKIGIGDEIQVKDPSLAEITMELLSSQIRPFSTNEIIASWQKYCIDLPGVKSLVFKNSMFSTGHDIDIQLSAPDFNVLLDIVKDVKNQLLRYQGVHDIHDNFEKGKDEVKLHLKPDAALHGITLHDLARQVRQGFYGDEALRIQRENYEVKVIVRYKMEYRKTVSDIENIMIRTKAGKQIPFTDVAYVFPGKSYAQINRSNQKRYISIIGRIDDEKGNANQINNAIKRYIRNELLPKYPGLVFSAEGEQREQQRTLTSVYKGFGIALLFIYLLIAIPFGSYWQPLIVMGAIPFGMIGAIVGHCIMGYDISIYSALGVVALSGVVVNDSLVFLSFYNECRKKRIDCYTAVFITVQKRFRAIFLTSLTTFCGLMPMLLEKSLQAKMLIPMTISLSFGIVFSTIITLILIPCVLVLHLDFKTLYRTVTVQEH